MRVVQLIDHLGLGGAQTQLARIAPLLAQSGCEIHVVCLRGPTALSRSIEQAGIPVTTFDAARWNPIQIVRLVQLLRQIKPTIVHTHLTAAGLLGRIGARFAEIPHVLVHEHLGLAYELTTTPVPVLLAQRAADHWLMQAADRWISVSEAARQAKIAIQHLPPEQVITIFNGLDPHPYRAARIQRTAIRAALGIAADQLVIIVVGRLLKSKGQHILLQALAKLRELDRYICLIVGNGPDEEPLREQAAQLGIENNVRFLGRRDDIPQLLAGSDVFVLPSYSEAFSVAILEAMAAGLPIVATAVGGAIEQLDDGDCGILIRPGDSAALTSALTRLQTDSAARAQLGAAAEQRLGKCFTIDIMIRHLHALYSELSNGAIDRP